MLCSTCAYRTDVFYNFKLKVQESDKILRMILENQMDIKVIKINQFCIYNNVSYMKIIQCYINSI